MRGQRKQGSEWWSEKIGLAVAKTRRAFEGLLKRDRHTYGRYQAPRAVVNWAVNIAKRMADWQWGERLRNDFEGNKKMFWKEVKQVGKVSK